MSYQVIGKCSLCGGEVVLDDHWMATVPQKPYCRSCHATARPPQNVIDMEPPSKGNVYRTCTCGQTAGGPCEVHGGIAWPEPSRTTGR